MRLIIACRAIDNMAGGVERQALALANEMTRRGHTVGLLTLDGQNAQAFYDIDSHVEWFKLSLGNPKVKAGLRLRLQRMAKVRAILSAFKPDVILAFQQGMFLTLRLYTLGTGIPVIAAERESPYRYDFIKDGRYRDLIFQTFRMARAMTVQCESYIQGYPRYLHRKITPIPNPVFPAHDYAAPAGEAAQPKILLCVGRLSFAKNQMALLEAFAGLTEEYPQWTLLLAGEGEDRPKIEAVMQTLHIGDKVRVLGAVKNITDYYKTAHALCIPSRFEGFPNVLGEALAHGLPAVGYQGCGGVRDLIQHGYNGLLAAGNGDVQTLRAALAQLMSDAAMRKEMGQNAIKSVERYQPDHVYDKWETFLNEVGTG